MRHRALSIILSLLATESVCAKASPEMFAAARLIEGTSFVTPMVQSHEGITDACGFEFKAMSFDTAYLGGDPVIINGSLAIRLFNPKAVGIAYKLGTFQFEGTELKSSAPTFAWIKVGSVLIKPKKSVPSDSEGYTLYISELPSDMKSFLKALYEQQEVKVGFNRREGGMDVVVPIDLSVRDTAFEGTKVVRKRDKTLAPVLSQCVKELFDGMKD